MRETLRTYSVGLDEARVEPLGSVVLFGEYKSAREKFVDYTAEQMVTNLGERYNVLLSSYEYRIKNGQLWGKDMDEPAIDSFIRGRDHRRRHGNAIDFRREDAEIEGFKKIEALFADPDTPVGSVMLSVSPPGREGSIYQKRFHDIHTLREDEMGKRYVESRRYSSGLDVDEYIEKLSIFADIEADETDPAVSFLANPIMIGNTITADSLHFYLHRDHEFTNIESFELIRSNVKHLIRGYAESLIREPYNKKLHRILFNTILNKADAINAQLRRYGAGDFDSRVFAAIFIENEIENYGYRKVRETMAGCGASSGYELEKFGKSPYSVTEFGKKKWDYKDGDCVVCKKRGIKVGPCSICKGCERKFDKKENEAKIA